MSRHFSILRSVGLIAKHQRGSGTFYESNSPERFISYAFKDDATEKDSARIQRLLRDSLGKREKLIVKDSLRKATPNV